MTRLGIVARFWRARKGKGWLAQETEPGTVHVLPLNDSIEHVESGDCACVPRVDVVECDDAPDGCIFIHSSLDGRELHEHQ